MSSPETDSNSDPNVRAAPGDESTRRKRPWGWIAVAGVLAAGLVGIGIYSMNTKSDLDDANAKVASQQQQIASQQTQIDEAQSAGAGAVAAAEAAFGKLSAQLGAVQQDATQTSEQAAAKLSQAEQTAAEAKGTAEEVKKNAAAAEAKAEAAATCAQSFLSAFSGVFGGSTLKEGIEATVAELKNVQPQCTSALGQDGSGS
jgi:chromosome segregation ATPase